MDQLKNSIFVTENERLQKIKKFNDMHYMESKENYSLPDPPLEYELDINILQEREALAKKIHSNFDKLTNEELVEMANICRTENEHKRKLLCFELKYFREKPRSMTLEEFKENAIRILKRYQSKAGGFKIEDSEWLIYSVADVDDNHLVMDNELLFENSICKCDEDDIETNRYLDMIIDRLNSLSNEIDVDLHFNYLDSLVWIRIWATHKKMGKKKPKISL